MKALRWALAALALAAAHAAAQQDPFPLPPKDWPKPVMDTERFTFLLLDRLEYRWQKGDNAAVWDAQAWWGGDSNKLWLKSEGEKAAGHTEEAEIQALYARRIAPFWHLQAGVRHEARPEPAQNYAVLALQGMAPYWLELDASLFMRAGELSGRLEAEHDLLLTQRLILEPSLEVNFAGAAGPARGIGKGVNDLELGLRLRYELRREIAPYIGVTWTRKAGDTADLVRAGGEDASVLALVAGIRLWY